MIVNGKVPASQTIDAKRAAKRLFAPKGQPNPDGILEEPLPDHRTVQTGRPHFCYGPAAAADGKVRLFSGDSTIAVDTTDFQVVSNESIGSAHPHGDFLPPACGPNGVWYYTVWKNQYWAVSNPPRIRGLQDGREVLNVEAGGTVTSPIMFGPNGSLVYGTDAGRVEVKDASDGHSLASVAIMPAAVKSKDARIDVAVQAADKSLYVQTTDNWLLHTSEKGELLWGQELPFAVRTIPPQLSQDGQTVYISGVQNRFLALDASSGREKWSHAYADHSVGEPAQDRSGSIYTYTSTGHVLKWTADGTLRQDIDTGLSVYVGGSRNFSRVALDKEDNICVQAGSNRFMVFDQGGDKLQDVSASRLFGFGKNDDNFHGFTMSPEKDKAYLLDQYRRLAEVMLPYPSQREEARVVCADDSVTIGKLKIPRRKQ